MSGFGSISLVIDNFDKSFVVSRIEHGQFLLAWLGTAVWEMHSLFPHCIARHVVYGLAINRNTTIGVKLRSLSNGRFGVIVPKHLVASGDPTH